MLSGLILAAAALLAAEPAPPPNTEVNDAILREYEAQAAKVGTDAAAQVRLALWCEANGLSSLRMKHLAIAVLRDPSQPLARGMMGLVEFNGRWLRPEAVAAKVNADEERAAASARYLDKRAKTPNTADDQYKLALWCEQNGLKAESTAHLHAVLRIDPSRESVWKRLGYKKINGRWISDDQIATEKQDAELQKHADRQWHAALEVHRHGLMSSSKERRASAEAALGRINDPRAVPSVWAVFGTSKDPKMQMVAVQVYGQLDSASASRGLAYLSVYGLTPEIRRSAAETLKRRDLREFADMLVAMVIAPIKYEVKQVGGQGNPGTLSVHGDDADLKRIYTPPSVQLPGILPGDQVGVDENGMPVAYRTMVTGPTYRLPTAAAQNRAAANGVAQFKAKLPALMAKNGANPTVISAAEAAASNLSASVPWASWGSSPMFSNFTRYTATPTTTVQIPVGQIMAEAESANAAARQRLQDDVTQLENYNRAAAVVNDRVLPVLNGISGQNFGPDPRAWDKWWQDQVGVALMPLKTPDSTTVVEQVPIDFQAAPISPTAVATGAVIRRSQSCFGAGTMVKTMTGERPIETLEVGDLVLAQNIKTGALNYQPILKVYHNPPNKTFQVNIAGEAIVSSGFHRFWVPGRGWVMARDLKAGDHLRTLGGSAAVTSLEDDRDQPVYNLDVAHDADFFVGRAGTLAHDMSLPDLRLAPFDGIAESAYVH